MSSILRQSSNLARVSFQTAGRSCIRNPSRACLPRCRVYAQGVRSYATEPEKPKNSPAKKEASNPKKPASKATEKKVEKPSKAAPGTENLYDQNTPLNPPTEEQTEEPSKPPELPEGWVHMTPEEERDLRGMLKVPWTASDGKPPGERLERQIDWMKKEGMPIELRELLGSDKGKPISLAKAQKLWRVLVKVAEKQADIMTKEGTSGQDGGAGGQAPPGNGGPKRQLPKSFKADVKFDLQSFLVSVFVSYLLYRMVVPGENGKDITYQEFRAQFLEKGLVEKLTVEGNRVRVELNREATQSVYPDSPAINSNFYYYFSIGSIDSFERHLDAAQEELGIPVAERIPISYTSAQPSDIFHLLINFGPTLLLVGSIWFLTRGASKGAGGSSGIFGMGKSRAKQFNHETDVKVKFKDVAGMDEAKLEIMEFVSFLKTPEKFQRLGAKIPRGAILSGPPGTGKTLLAKATAGESQVPFFSVSGSEFVEMFVGVGASRVRDLFAMARKSTPCIIFIDEIDAIGKARGKGVYGGNDEREATLNQILTEMDGFNTQEQVVVLAGTNRADVLDKALMRPGRFDRHIAIDRPTMEGRKQIFLVHLAKIVTTEDMEYLSGRLSALTPGFSGADIANCVNEAALIAARSSAKSVVMTHFEQAIERVVGGLEKKSLVLSSEERKTVAYHEAGHAICGWFFKHADPLLKVSIIPRGQGALGYAQYIPASDVYLMNVNQLMDRMAMTLGGRISEELHFETVTSGASDDFNKVTRMATAMVTKWGMSKKLGPLHFEDDENRMHKPFAEATAQMIDAEVSRIVHEAYKQCQDLLTEKKKQVGVVAEELLRKEMLDRNDMVRLLGPREWDENKEFVKYFGPGGEKSAPPPFPGEAGVEEGGSAVL